MKKVIFIVIAIAAISGIANSQSSRTISNGSSVGLVCDYGCSEDGGVCLFNHRDCKNDPRNCGGIGSACGAGQECADGGCYSCDGTPGGCKRLESPPPDVLSIQMLNKRPRKLWSY